MVGCRVSYSSDCSAAGMRHNFVLAQFYSQNNGNFQRCLLCFKIMMKMKSKWILTLCAFLAFLALQKLFFAKKLRLQYHSFKNLI